MKMRYRSCNYCKKQYTYKRRTSKFCSGNCRIEARNKRRSLIKRHQNALEFLAELTSNETNEFSDWEIIKLMNRK